ncbi:MAG TPA: MtrB/PioB family decaheme-associated outer membrane protein [Noviherbaspirillum sp.]|nr:MtrB/PioB family decaheme-associated outer membrane protein [Noviherbaspirillum sp.]
MTMQKHLSFPLTAMTAAVLAAWNPAYALDEEIVELTRPSSSIAVGASYLSNDAPRFGRHSGLNDEGAYGLLNVDINKRDDSTGTWLRFKGNNLGLESRDMRITHVRQGDWAYYVDYSEIPRFEPYTVNTAVTGIGTANLVIPSSAAAVEVPVDLKIKREALGLGYSKVLAKGLDFTVRMRNEEKDGARIFARGTPSVWEFAPEPINSTTRQLDAILGYTTDKMHIAGSYYGTWYNNANSALRISGGNSGLSTFNVIGLPPDTQSHQLAVSGNYDFTPATRANFKAAYARAQQQDTFLSGVTVAPGIDPNGNLGARVDTTQLQFGVTARPTSKLSLLADARYEDRDDKTPVRLYTNAGVSPTATYNGENEPRSIKTTSGKLEASYRLPMEMRVTGGVDYVEKERNTSAIRVVSFRDKTDETSYRIVLQRSMSETITGSFGYIFSDRNGSDFRTNVLNCGAVSCNGATAFNLIAPLHLSDRERQKLRFSLNWTPLEQLSVQYQTELTFDDYGHRTPEEFGLRDGASRNHSIDVSYAFSDEWQATAWISKSDTEANSANRISATNTWAGLVRNNADSFGLGIRGKPFSKLEIGADLSHSDITDSFRQTALTGPAVSSLPDYFTRQSTLKLFGTYALDKSASVRLDYIYDRYITNDWTWSSWVYSDGTTLTQRPRQNVNFIGITYIYRFY